MHWDAKTNENVRRWLGTVPRPQVVRGELPNGEERRVVMPRRGKLLDVAASLDGCVRVEALDPDDQVLRSLDLDDVASVQEPPPDMNRGELGQIARIISDAHDRGAKTALEATKAGNDAVSKLMMMTLERVTALERLVQTNLQAQARDIDRERADLERREVELATQQQDAADEHGLDGAAKSLVEAAAPAIGAALATKLFGGGDDKKKDPPAPNGAASS